MPSPTGSVVVIAYGAGDDPPQQIEADVRFQHEESNTWYRVLTHTPKGGYLQVGWPLGWWRFEASAPGYALREGRCLLTPYTKSWKLYLCKEASDA